MINPRKHLKYVERDVQNYDTREEFCRLDMNEYLPYANKELYDKLFENINNETISGYPMVNLAYKSISNFINEPIDKIVLTNGSDGVILSTLLAFCEPGDTISYVAPTYGMYQVYANMLNINTKTINYNADFSLDIQKLEDMIDNDIKVMIIANPNGIVGDEIEEEIIIKLLEKANKHGVVLLIDEVYAGFQDYGTSRFLKYTNKYDNLVIARSFSKSFGLAGIRAGYSISHKETRKFLIAVRNNVEINSIAVEAIKVWCDNKECLDRSIKEIIESKKYICEEFSKLGINCKNGKTNFILIKIPEGSRDKIKKALQDNNILVKSIESLFEGYWRVTVGTKAYMKKFVDVVKDNL